MKISLEIHDPENIKWLESIPKDKKNDIIRNCITIGRLTLENCNIQIDKSKYLEPVIEHFKTITKNEMDKALTTVQNSLEKIQETRKDILDISKNITSEMKENTSTVMSCMKQQNSLTEKIIEPITSRIDKMNQEVEKIFSVKSTSNSKGKLGESIIEQHILTSFPNYEIKNMSQTGHEADFQIQTDFGKVLLEVKTYSTNVSREQIEKFYKDIERTGFTLAIFLSTTSGIVGKKTMEWEIYGKNKTIILYFPNSGFQLESIIFSFLFLKALNDANITKRADTQLIKSNEDLLELFSMLDTFYKDLLDLLEKQSKMKYQIQTTRTNMNKLMDDLYKQSFDVELEHKSILDFMYSKIKERYTQNKSIESYQIIQDHIEFTKCISTLSLKPNQIQIFEKLYILLEPGKNKLFYEGQKMLLVDTRKNTKIATIQISKTKIELLFDISKESTNISLNPKYESYKTNQIICLLENELDSISCLENRITSQIDTN